MFFEIRGEILQIETFAAGTSIRELPRLRKLYGRARWRKRKGLASVKLSSGTIRNAELHWYEASGIALSRLIMRAKTKEFAVCLQNTGYAASLEVRKLYAVIDDPDAEANDLIRVVDESGEDYLYPSRLFRKLVLPGDVQRALRMAS